MQFKSPKSSTHLGIQLLWRMSSQIKSFWRQKFRHKLKDKIGLLTSACYTTLKMLSWPSAWHVDIPVTNPELVEGRLSWHIKNLDTFQSHIDCRDYSCHQGLLSTWYDTNHTMRLMEWWFILLMMKPRNTLTVCILTFQLNQGTCVIWRMKIKKRKEGLRGKATILS